MLIRLRSNVEAQPIVLSICADDICYWVNNFVWTYDPRLSDPVVPFDLFLKQEEFLVWLAAREGAQEDGVAEKSRDSGLTWLCGAYATHGWLFRDGFKAGFGSRKLDLVDKLGDTDSILEKARFIVDKLPHWMRPRNYTMGFCNLQNKDRGSSIIGESGDEVGRGGRNTVYFGDEHAFWERAKRAEAALSQNTRCIIRVSTPNGPGNEFHTKRFSGTVPVFTFHWRDDPRKSPAWYEREKQRIGDPVIIAQELDIDYSASVEGICIPAAWVLSGVNFADWLQQEHGIDMRADGPLVAALDIADEGKNRSVLGFRRGAVVQSPILDWGQKSSTWTANEALDQCEKRGVAYLNYDAGGGFGGPLKNRAEVEENAKDNAAPAGRIQSARVTAIGLNGGSTPSKTKWPNGKAAHEMFLNARAEWWWTLRTRFERCYEWREKGIAHKPEDCISIPTHATLIAQLSLPLYDRTQTGKIQLESKKKMQSRGAASPDHADMLAYLFAERKVFVPFAVGSSD